MCDCPIEFLNFKFGIGYICPIPRLQEVLAFAIWSGLSLAPIQIVVETGVNQKDETETQNHNSQQVYLVQKNSPKPLDWQRR